MDRLKYLGQFIIKSQMSNIYEFHYDLANVLVKKLLGLSFVISMWYFKEFYLGSSYNVQTIECQRAITPSNIILIDVAICPDPDK